MLERVVVGVDTMGRPRRRTTLRALLAAGYTRGGVDECWEWNGPRGTTGYGLVTHTWHGRSRIASRLMYEQTADVLLDEAVVVRHSCDNPPCVNPNHLLPGTRADNARDAVERGRMARQRNELSGKARLTNEQVRIIRALRGEGRSLVDVARAFGISNGHASRICAGARRPPEAGDSLPLSPSVANREARNVRDQQAADWYKQGLATTEIARRLGTHPGNIYRILDGLGVIEPRTAAYYAVPVDAGRILQLHGIGWSFRAIAQDQGVGHQRVANVVRGAAASPAEALARGWALPRNDVA